MSQRDYDSTVARIAGNIAAGLVARNDSRLDFRCTAPELRKFEKSIAEITVGMARAIVAEVKRTEPKNG